MESITKYKHIQQIWQFLAKYCISNIYLIIYKPKMVGASLSSHLNHRPHISNYYTYVLAQHIEGD
jgi:hypothetical protein